MLFPASFLPKYPTGYASYCFIVTSNQAIYCMLYAQVIIWTYIKLSRSTCMPKSSSLRLSSGANSQQLRLGKDQVEVSLTVFNRKEPAVPSFLLGQKHSLRRLLTFSWKPKTIRAIRLGEPYAGGIYRNRNFIFRCHVIFGKSHDLSKQF